MTRIVIENAVLFLLPTGLYVGYVLLTRDGGNKSQILDEAPLIWLFLAGALLVILVLLTFGSTSGGRPDQHYVPPSMHDGKIEPGEIK